MRSLGRQPHLSEQALNSPVDTAYLPHMSINCAAERSSPQTAADVPLSVWAYLLLRRHSLVRPLQREPQREGDVLRRQRGRHIFLRTARWLVGGTNVRQRAERTVTSTNESDVAASSSTAATSQTRAVRDSAEQIGARTSHTHHSRPGPARASTTRAECRWGSWSSGSPQGVGSAGAWVGPD
jgi:hypothetical protein